MAPNKDFSICQMCKDSDKGCSVCDGMSFEVKPLYYAAPAMYKALQAWMVYLKDPNCGWLSKAQYLTTKALALAEGRKD